MANISVLVVDDENDFLIPLAKRLALRELDVQSASSGRQALQMLDKAPVDVVVLDVKMPKMDGIEVISRIKAQHPLVEVIMLTGHANLEASMQGMELGAFDYLIKPADIDSLVYKIQDAFKRKTLQMRRQRVNANTPDE